MHTTLLRLPVRRRRDVVLARHQARQIARLLGFEPREQACIAAAVFEIACTALDRRGRAALEFRLSDDRFEVFRTSVAAPDLPEAWLLPAVGLRLEKPLPERACEVDPSDLAWVVGEVTRLAPLDLFEEMRRQNQEMLRAVSDLRTASPEPARVAARQKPAA